MSDMGVSAEDLAAAINQIPEEKRAEVIALIKGKEESEELINFAKYLISKRK